MNNNNRTYKALLFDLDGTVLDYVALFNAYKHAFGVNAPDALLEVYHEINSALWGQFEKGIIDITNLKYRRFADLFSHFNLDADPSAFSDYYLQELGNGGYLMKGALEILTFCSKHFRLGAITNGIGDVQRSRLNKAGIDQFFETVVISNDVGIAKPDPGIFNIAFKDMNLNNKEEILMIGDSLSSDILGGINAGIDTCWINNDIKEAGKIKPVYTILKITELVEIVH